MFGWEIKAKNSRRMQAFVWLFSTFFHNFLFEAMWCFGHCECQLTSMYLTGRTCGGRWCGDDLLYHYCWCALTIWYCRHIVEIHRTWIESDTINQHTVTSTSSLLGYSAELQVGKGRVRITKPDLTVKDSMEWTQECTADTQVVVAVHMYPHRQNIISPIWYRFEIWIKAEIIIIFFEVSNDNELTILKKMQLWPS